VDWSSVTLEATITIGLAMIGFIFVLFILDEKFEFLFN
jgi:hypothetical protein